MTASRMNLFKSVAGREKPSARAKSSKRFSPQLVTVVLAVIGGLALNLQSSRKHKQRMEEMRAEMSSLDAEIREIVALSDQVRAEKAGRKTAGLRPSGMDGTWTAVLWKFAAFTGQRVVIREMQLAPQSAGGKIQSVAIRGQAVSIVEMREWLQRLIENMPGSEFSISNHKTTDDGEFPVVFTLMAQVI